MRHKEPNTTVAQVRKVWAVLTRNPHLTYRELSQASGVSFGCTRRGVAQLQRLGYIERAPGLERAIRVVVPFVEVAHGD